MKAILKNKKFLILAAVTLVAVIALVVILSGGEEKVKNPVNISDYLIIEESGFDTRGSLYISVNYTQLVKDHADKLTGETPEDAALYFQDYDEAVYEYAARCDILRPIFEYSDTMKNGDQVQVTWEINDRALEEFRKALDITPIYEDFTYTMENLNPMTEFDPFENLRNYTRGYSGNGYTDSVSATATNAQGEEYHIRLNVTSDQNGRLKNGDTVHVSLERESDAETCLEYGICLTRTEADLPVVNLSYYAAEVSDEILSYLNQDTIDLVSKALEEKYSTYVGTITYEYIGAIIHYSTEEEYLYKNRISFIYHVENGIYPGGWYTYMSPTASVGITVTENEDGSLDKRLTPVYDEFKDAKYYYRTEEHTFWGSDNNYFKYEGLFYGGSLTLEDCIKNLQKAELGVRWDDDGNITKQTYNHAIATEALQAYAY